MAGGKVQVAERQRGSAVGRATASLELLQEWVQRSVRTQCSLRAQVGSDRLKGWVTGQLTLDFF